VDSALTGFMAAISIAGFFGGIFMVGLLCIIFYEEVKGKNKDPNDWS